MSRSYKKHPFVKDRNPDFKRLFNRRIRRSSRTKDIASGGSYRKCNNSYDICDFKWSYNWEEFKEQNWTRNQYFDSEEEAYAHWKKYYWSK